jgi:hypothetical protein
MTPAESMALRELEAAEEAVAAALLALEAARERLAVVMRRERARARARAHLFVVRAAR